MKYTQFLASLMLFFSVSSLAVAQSVTDLFKPSLRIIRGVPVSTKNSSIVQVLMSDGQGSFLCTGTLITKQVVLTARHCVSRTASRMNVVAANSTRSVSKVRIHPGAYEDRKSGVIYNDMALVFLRRAVSLPTVAVLSSRAIVPGQQFTILGYGLTESGRTGKLRRGAMALDRTDSDFIYARYDGTLSNTCEGDSGGPAITSYIDANGATRTGIVGVTSGGLRQDCGINDLSYFANVQSATSLDFLRRNVKGLSEQ